MPKDAVALCSGFTGHLRYLDMTRKKMETLYLKRIVVKRDIEQVYLGLFMDTLTSFEQLIEELFVGLLSRRFVVQQAIIVPLMIFKNTKAIRPVIYGGRQYVDWLPYHRTETLAGVYFEGGGPFTNLDKNNKKSIEQCSIVRNAIAHKSKHAKNRFERVVLAQHAHLMTPEKKPAGYLRGEIQDNPVRTRYEYLAAELESVSWKLCS